MSMEKKGLRGSASFIRMFMLTWMLLNILALPLTFAQDEETITSVVAHEAPLTTGEWGKVVSLGGGDIETKNQENEHGEVAVHSSNPILVMLLLIAAIVGLFSASRMDSRSQISIFILLGLTMMISFFFLFFIMTSTSTQPKENLDQSTRTVLETSAIKYYVYTCLDQASVEVIRELGFQGGFIHEHQPGAVINWTIPTYNFTLGNESHNVSYQIYSQTSGEMEPIDSHIRDDGPGNIHNYYPCKRDYTNAFYDSVQDDLCLKSYNHTLEGFGTLGKKLIGSGTTGLASTVNKKVIPDLCTDAVDLNIFKCVCPPNHECNYSIQRQLESAIKNRTMDCLDFSSFTGYNITYAEPNITVAIDADYIGVLLDLPLSIKWKDKIPQTLIQQFHSLYQVRLKTIYPMLFGGNLLLPGGSALNNITGIVNDDLKFDYHLIDDGQALLNTLGNLKITTYNPDTNTTIVVINDTKSNIGGYPYIFMFAIENRKPALDWFEEEPFTWALDGKEYQVVVSEGDTINLTPYAVDPDDDQLLYSYSGWKADWDDQFNDAAFGYSDMMFTVPTAVNEWHTSQPYLAGCNDPYGENTVGRCALYNTTHADVGYHNVTITVTDPNGEQDWQMVRVLVVDYPEVAFDLDNYYADVPNNYASTEDIFEVNVSSTTSFIGSGPIQWLWQDSAAPTIIPASYQVFSQTNDVLYYPQGGPAVWDIDSIHSPGGEFTMTGPYDLTVHAKRGSGNAGNKTFTISVEECLPHRSTSAPYPWNNGVVGLVNTANFPPEGDPFQANHTCCADDFSISSTGICYEHHDFGPWQAGPGYKSFNSFGVALVGSSTQVITDVYNVTVPGSPSNEESFDVYRRDFNVSCDGMSGNTCHPTLSNTQHTVTRVLDCPDDPTDDEGCSYGGYGDYPYCVDVPSGFGIDFAARQITIGQSCGAPICSTNNFGGVILPPGDTCVAPFCYLVTRTCNGAGKCSTITSSSSCSSCTNNYDLVTGDFTGANCIP